jgi:hypothetical protein
MPIFPSPPPRVSPEGILRVACCTASLPVTEENDALAVGTPLPHDRGSRQRVPGERSLQQLIAEPNLTHHHSSSTSTLCLLPQPHPEFRDRPKVHSTSSRNSHDDHCRRQTSAMRTIQALPGAPHVSNSVAGAPMRGIDVNMDNMTSAAGRARLHCNWMASRPDFISFAATVATVSMKLFAISMMTWPAYLHLGAPDGYCVRCTQLGARYMHTIRVRDAILIPRHGVLISAR